MTQPRSLGIRCALGVSARCHQTTDRSRSVQSHCRPFPASRVRLLFLLGITPAALPTTAAAQSMAFSVDCSAMTHDQCVNHVNGVIQNHINHHDEELHTLIDHLVNGGSNHGPVPFVVPQHILAESKQRQHEAAIQRQCNTDVFDDFVACTIAGAVGGNFTSLLLKASPKAHLILTGGAVLGCGVAYAYLYVRRRCGQEQDRFDREAAEYIRSQESRNERNSFMEEAIRRNQFNLDAVTFTETKDKKKARKKRDKARKKRDKTASQWRPSL